MYILIPRASTIIQEDIAKKSTDKLKWNARIHSHNPKEGRKGVADEQKLTRKNRH